jgi:hypothetical protein
MFTFASAQAHVFARRAALVAGVVCTVVAWAFNGVDGLAAGALAAAMAVVFFWTGMIPLWAAKGAGAVAGFGVLLLTFGLRVALALLALQLTRELAVVDPSWFAVTIIVCALTWLNVHVIAFLKAGRPRPAENTGPAVNADTTTK